jgi:hypothetical protein
MVMEVSAVNLKYLLFLLAFVAIGPLAVPSGAQASSDTYAKIQERPSTIRWCLPKAGDDPAHIIGGRCEVYRECLSGAALDESVDRTPFPSLDAEKVEVLRKCHQALFNGAIVNPQIKGSAATQKWLLHMVYPGTEAKSFPIPGITGDPR